MTKAHTQDSRPKGLLSIVVALLTLPALTVLVVANPAAADITDPGTTFPECPIVDEDPFCPEDPDPDPEEEEDDFWCSIFPDTCNNGGGGGGNDGGGGGGNDGGQPDDPNDEWPPPGIEDILDDFPDFGPIDPQPDPTPPGPCKNRCHEPGPSGPILQWN